MQVIAFLLFLTLLVVHFTVSKVDKNVLIFSALATLLSLMLL